MSEPIDFSCLDPTRDPERWEARIAETLSQAELVRGFDLSPLQPFASDEADRIAETILQAALVRDLDLSALAPTLDELRVAETLSQAERVRGLDLARLDPHAGEKGEAERAEVVRQATAPSVVAPVVELAPRALGLAACLAAAAWLLVWFAPPSNGADVGADPALALMSWAESGEALTREQMGIVTGGVSHER